MERMKSLLLLLLLLSYWLAAEAGMRSSDADAIADLARCLADPPSSWTGSGANACSSFEGISCSSSGRVTAINLAGKGLIGSLPSSLSSLTVLESLQLQGNALSGAVPSLSGQVTNLSLDGNAFTSLPNNFPQGMPALQHLSMDDLPLAPWPFPDAIAGCPSLDTFSASNASITGPFTSSAIANLRGLRKLILANNHLTGVIPASLLKMTSLRNISLSRNYFQGPLPDFPPGVFADVIAGNSFCLEMPGPCNAQVTTLLEVAEGFGYPLLLAESWTGNDPCIARRWRGVTCNMSDVAMIDMTGFNLSGTISPAIANLTGLRKLVLANNQLTGGIPSALTTLPELELLDVTNNGLTGQLPKFKPSVRVSSDGNRFEESGAAADGGGSSSSGSGADASPVSNAGTILAILVAVLVL